MSVSRSLIESYVRLWQESNPGGFPPEVPGRMQKIPLMLKGKKFGSMIVLNERIVIRIKGSPLLGEGSFKKVESIVGIKLVGPEKSIQIAYNQIVFVHEKWGEDFPHKIMDGEMRTAIGLHPHVAPMTKEYTYRTRKWPFKQCYFMDRGLKSLTQVQTTEMQFYKFASHMLRGIGHFHTVGYLHGDIKLENFLVFQDKNGEFIVKVIDLDDAAPTGGKVREGTQTLDFISIEHRVELMSKYGWSTTAEGRDFYNEYGRYRQFFQTINTETSSMGFVLADFYYIQRKHLHSAEKKEALFQLIGELTGGFAPKPEDLNWEGFVTRVDTYLRSVPYVAPDERISLVEAAERLEGLI